MSAALPPSSDDGEFDLHERIARLLGPAKRVDVGIGDDAAVLAKLEGRAAFCSDAIVEGVHFDLRWSTPADLAWKALGSCLSDLAAMGARPVAATVALALPRAGARAFIEAFYAEARELAALWDFDVAGGDLVASPGPIFIDVACVGDVARPVLRSGARAGDVLALSGPLGAAAAGLEALRRGDDEPALRARQLRPRPRFDRAADLARASAALDVSDGLASDLRRLARASGVGARLTAIPCDAQAELYARKRNLDARVWPRAWALGGGEDYELLAAFPVDAWTSALAQDPAFAQRWLEIGRCTPASEGLLVADAAGQLAPLPDAGFDHFR